WIKGAYYDPNYGGAGIGGWWWANVNGTNNAPNFGPPGQGEGNAGFNLSGEGHFRIPLMAYPQTVSPWGMLDASGATTEFLETVQVIGTIPYRTIKGSAWSEFGSRSNVVYSRGGEFANSSTYQLGLRIATVPTPQAYLVIAAGFAALTCRRVRVSAKEMTDETFARAGCPPDRRGPRSYRCR
ncbi:MAG: hypothetical protein JNK25_09310, partial [Phycisphaerae bacterium]|nr:hypothetical protein [Phycisphaerae bacterium]